MSSGKTRSSFQITSVTSEPNLTPAGQSAPSMVLNVLQSETSSCSRQGSSSQPTTPCLKRKYITHDAQRQGGGSSSRFRVVRLSVCGADGGGRSKPYRRGRWTCTDFMERPEWSGIRRVMDSMRNAHSLESLEMIGRNRERGWVHSQDTSHLLAQPVRSREEMHSSPPSPTHEEPINICLLEQTQPKGVQGLDSTLSPTSPHPQKPPPPLRLDMDANGRSVLRLSHSQPSSPPAGPYQPTLIPIHTSAAYSLDQMVFNLPGDYRNTDCDFTELPEHF
ncbi:TSC22 domain family protein 4-like isoform X2 [Anabas testudineus]|uniref:TSC22 domain family protein 4-like isoform X2 n=1 Tax=Anabas testudineus TaxID=64144 RepID=UPI000E465C82|nr:TSC22 domain family protein 4-like isoform X2 [Anabas testudineus]XP_033182569.1 TSC22 domain family protein 4-like isoform X2 [Anabas testudineus]